MKAHIGVDSRPELIHSVVATAANVHDSRVLGDLLDGDETRVCGDSAYANRGETIREAAPKAQDFTLEKGHRCRKLSEEERAKNRTKSAWARSPGKSKNASVGVDKSALP